MRGEAQAEAWLRKSESFKSLACRAATHSALSGAKRAACPPCRNPVALCVPAFPDRVTIDKLGVKMDAPPNKDENLSLPRGNGRGATRSH